MDSRLIDRQQRLAAAQARARTLRHRSFVRYKPFVAGHTLEPITLESYNRLLAFENAFVAGGPISFNDIAVFVWVHHKDFGQFSSARGPVIRSVWRALNPKFPALNFLLAVFLPLMPYRRMSAGRPLSWIMAPVRRLMVSLVRPTHAARVATAVQEIRRLLDEALFDMPPPEDGMDGASCEPAPYAFQAQLLNLFRRHLGMTFEETRRIPLCELAEHLREIIDSTAHGKKPLLTPEEAAIWREHLDERTKEEEARAAHGRN
jgi:hypothetical protein